MKNLIIILISIFAVQISYSQGGSNYSAIGLGEINYYNTSSYEAIGGTSIAFPQDNGINAVNPAMWSQNVSTRLMAGYKYNQHFNFSEESELFQNNGTISGINALFSIDTSKGIAAAFGITPYTRVKYYIAAPIGVDFDSDTITGKSYYQGKGGLNRLYTGLSFGIIKGVYIGLEGHLNFGTVQTLNSTEVYGDASTFNSYVYKNDYLYNFGYKIGFYTNLINNFGIGAYVENSGDMRLEREKSYFTLTPNKNDTIIESRADYSLPLAFGIGLSYKTGKFVMGADYSMQDFSDFEYNRGANSKYKNYSRMSAGICRLGNKSYSADYLDKITYKLGFSYIEQYYTVYNEDINDIALTFGMEMPVKGTGILDVSFNFGKRGIKNDQLLLEYYGRIGVDISIGETWFKPFRRRY